MYRNIVMEGDGRMQDTLELKHDNGFNKISAYRIYDIYTDTMYKY